MHTQPELAMKEEGWDTVGYFFSKSAITIPTLIEKKISPDTSKFKRVIDLK